MFGLNSLLLPLLLGFGLSPDLIKNIQAEKEKTLEKWRLALRMLAEVILGYIFFKRAPIPALDSAGKAVYNDEGIQKSLNASFEENAFANWIKGMVFSAIDMAIELMKPSSSEAMILSAVLGATKPASSTTVIQQQQPQAPLQVPWMGNQNTMSGLRNARFQGGRAQGAVIMPDGSIVTD